jgi:hypothetical protein
MPRVPEVAEAWRRAWRLGFAPQFSPEALGTLAEALRSDSPMLMHGTLSLL